MPAPGREGATPSPPPTTAQPTQAPPPDGSAPPSSPFGGSTILLFMLPLVLIFLMTRNQTKKQKQLESSLKVGDTVVTQSGLIGKILEMGERKAKVEIAPGVNVQMLKSSIQGVDGGDKKPEDAKADKAADSKKEPLKDKAQDKKA